MVHIASWSSYSKVQNWYTLLAPDHTQSIERVGPPRSFPSSNAMAGGDSSSSTAREVRASTRLRKKQKRQQEEEEEKGANPLDPRFSDYDPKEGEYVFTRFQHSTLDLHMECTHPFPISSPSLPIFRLLHARFFSLANPSCVSDLNLNANRPARFDQVFHSTPTGPVYMCMHNPMFCLTIWCFYDNYLRNKV